MSSDSRDLRPRSRRELLAAIGTVGLGACLPESRLKRPLDMTPVRRGDWSVAEPGDVGLEAAAVRAAYERVFDPDQLPNIRSLLVARHGLLVAEGYVVSARDIERRGALMSATKSFTSILAGIAIDRGQLSLDVTVGDLFADLVGNDGKAAIRLRDTLTMRAGIDYSNDDFSIDMEWGGHPDSVRYILGKPLVTEPGTVFHYTDACAHLAGAIVQAATGETLGDYARTHLFSKLGISDFRWLAHADGRSFGAYGLFTTARDLLRFGQGMLESANGSARIVSPEWITESTSFRVEPDFGDGFDYGYLWWLAPEGNAFTASGHGGQFSYVVPELDLVVAITSDPNSNEEFVSVRHRDLHELVTTIASGAT